MSKKTFGTYYRFPPAPYKSFQGDTYMDLKQYVEDKYRNNKKQPINVKVAGYPVNYIYDYREIAD